MSAVNTSSTAPNSEEQEVESAADCAALLRQRRAITDSKGASAVRIGYYEYMSTHNNDPYRSLAVWIDALGVNAGKPEPEPEQTPVCHDTIDAVAPVERQVGL